MSRPDALDRRIVGIAVPAFAALVSEPLMLLVDTAIVGHLGTAELAGLAVAGVVLSTAIGLCVFLAYGTTAVVARRRGAGLLADAYASAVAGAWLAVGIGCVLAVATLVLGRRLCAALASSPAAADHAGDYLLVSAAGIPSMLLILAATGALRGTWDLRTPLVVAVTINLLDTVLSVTLVQGTGLGVRGAALGTVVAQGLGAAWLAAVLVRRARAAGADLRPRRWEVLDAARRGAPLLARTVFLRAALLLAVGVAATLGDAPLAAHQVAVTVVTALAFALDALAIAGQTLTGHALGAGDVAGARALTRRTMGWGAGFGTVAGVALAGLATCLPPVFSTDPAVADALVPALLVVAAIQPLSGIVFVLDGVLIGAGDGSYLARAGLVTLAAYAPCAVAVAVLDGSLAWLWAAYGVFIGARLVTLTRRAASDRWLVTGA